HGTGFHLLGNPFVDNAQFTDHHASPAFRLRSPELRSSIPPQRPKLFRNRSLLARLNLRSNPADFVAQAYIEHRLPGVLQQVHALSRRSSMVKMSTGGYTGIIRN